MTMWGIDPCMLATNFLAEMAKSPAVAVGDSL